MKTNFSIFFVSALALANLCSTGCGGANAQPVNIATDLAPSYDVKLVSAPAGVSLLEFNNISSDGKQIVGDVEDGDNLRAVRYTGGQLTIVTPADKWIRPYAVNNLGSIAATVSLTDSEFGCAINGDTPKYYPLAGDEVTGWTNATDDSGTVYRTTKLADSTYRAFADTASGSTQILIDGSTNVGIRAASPGGRIIAKASNEFKVLAPGGSTWSTVLAGESQISPNAISDQGTIVGTHSVGGKVMGFVCKDGVVTDIADSTSTYASLLAISTGDIAVGTDNVLVGANHKYHAFAWSKKSGFVDLNSRISVPGFELFKASGISDDGTIVGYGYQGSTMVGFILTPKQQ